MPVVGPFTGELSFEFVTWLPFLRREFGEDLVGVTAVSRGDTQFLYPCPVINAHDVMSCQELTDGFLARIAATRRLKAVETDPLEQEIMRRLGLRSILHPSRAMAMRPWSQFIPYLRRVTDLPRMPGLPEKYIAVRFYQNDWCRTVNADVLNEHCDGLPTIVLRPDKSLDDNAEFNGLNGNGKVEYQAFKSASTLTSVMAHAEKVITCYGGTPWMALLCGVPVEAFYDRGDEKYMHHDIDDALRQFAPYTVHKWSS